VVWQLFTNFWDRTEFEQFPWLWSNVWHFRRLYFFHNIRRNYFLLFLCFETKNEIKIYIFFNCQTRNYFKTKTFQNDFFLFGFSQFFRKMQNEKRMCPLAKWKTNVPSGKMKNEYALWQNEKRLCPLAKWKTNVPSGKMKNECALWQNEKRMCPLAKRKTNVPSGKMKNECALWQNEKRMCPLPIFNQAHHKVGIMFKPLIF